MSSSSSQTTTEQSTAPTTSTTSTSSDAPTSTTTTETTSETESSTTTTQSSTTQQSTTTSASTTSTTTSPTQTTSNTPSQATSTTTSSSNTATTLFTPTVITSPSTSVIQTASVGTSNGQAFTTTIQLTTIYAPGTTISAISEPSNGGSSTNAGAIAGGVVGGVGGLGLVALIIWFFLRKRRQDKDSDFDGNFDPARVVHGNVDNRFDLDDEAPGPSSINPFTAHLPQPQAEMQQYPSTRPSIDHHLLAAGAGAGAVAAGAYAYNNAQGPSQPQTTTASTSPSTTHHDVAYGYPPTSPISDGGYTSGSSVLPYTTSTVPMAMGRGPSPGPSVTVQSSDAGTGSVSGHGHGQPYTRSAKEREAFGGRMVVSNADEANRFTQPVPMAFPYPQPQHAQYPNVQPYAATAGPYYGQGPSSPPMPVPLASSNQPLVNHPYDQPVLEGSAVTANVTDNGSDVARKSNVLVHQDAGRVTGGEEDERSHQDEIPPTYDSLPVNERM